MNTNQDLLTPYAMIKLLNAAGYRTRKGAEVPTQMGYTYAKKGLGGLKTVESNGQLLVTRESADKWIASMVAKQTQQVEA